MRPNIDEYFMNIAKIVATRSTCLRHHVGSIIVKNKHIIATAYNGAPRGLPHCIDVGCIRDKENIPSGTQTERCSAVHSEINAIIQAALHGVSTDGATLYCTHQPCSSCAKAIINAGIKRVMYSEDYSDMEGLKLLAFANIVIKKFRYDKI
jgi:dCMP deaminase